VGLEQGLRSRCIKSGIFARRQVELAMRSTRFVAIVINECA
jgi:hypothetical protein